MTKTDLQNLTKWSKEQLAYMAILANPLEIRNDDEIADELKTTRQTLWNWRQIDGLVEQAYEMLIKNLYGKLGKVFAGLIKRANQGDASAARIILETIGKLKSQSIKNELNIGDNRKIVIGWETPSVCECGGKYVCKECGREM